jgi:hypothetical protein
MSQIAIEIEATDISSVHIDDPVLIRGYGIPLLGYYVRHDSENIVIKHRIECKATKANNYMYSKFINSIFDIKLVKFTG